MGPFPPSRLASEKAEKKNQQEELHVELCKNVSLLLKSHEKINFVVENLMGGRIKYFSSGQTVCCCAATTFFQIWVTSLKTHNFLNSTHRVLHSKPAPDLKLIFQTLLLYFESGTASFKSGVQLKKLLLIRLIDLV